MARSAPSYTYHETQASAVVKSQVVYYRLRCIDPASVPPWRPDCLPTLQFMVQLDGNMHCSLYTLASQYDHIILWFACIPFSLLLDCPSVLFGVSTWLDQPYKFLGKGILFLRSKTYMQRYRIGFAEMDLRIRSRSDRL
jgi:hypothetical protein